MYKKHAKFTSKTALAVATAIALNLTAVTTVSATTPLESPAPRAKVEDFKPDPKKRLTLKQFIKGAERLHGYLENAVAKANDADKKFLVKEKAELERQLKNPKKALAAQFKSIDAQIERLKKQALFSPPVIAQMRMHYLETEAGKVVGVLHREGKKPMVSEQVRGEIQYQLGLIAHRDQINYKTAMRHFGNAVKHQPKNVEYMTSQAELYTLLEDHGDAAKLYKDILVQLKQQSAPKEHIKAIKDKLAMATDARGR